MVKICYMPTPAPKGNVYALGNHGGRPPEYETPEQLMDKVEEYFKYCEGEFHMENRVLKEEDEDGNVSQKTVAVKIWDREPEQYKITKLCLFLGFCSRSSLDDNARRSREFSYIIKYAKMLVESAYEDRLTTKDNPTGAIFALKNMGWKDKTEIGHTDGEGNDIQPISFTYDELMKLKYGPNQDSHKATADEGGN